MRKYIFTFLLVMLPLSMNTLVSNVEAVSLIGKCSPRASGIKTPEKDSGRILLGCITGDAFNQDAVKALLRASLLYKQGVKTSQSPWLHELPSNLRDELYEVLSYWWALRNSTNKDPTFDTKVYETLKKDLEENITKLQKEFHTFWRNEEGYREKHSKSSTSNTTSSKGFDWDELNKEEQEYYMLLILQQHGDQISEEDLLELFSGSEEEKAEAHVAKEEHKTLDHQAAEQNGRAHVPADRRVFERSAKTSTSDHDV